MQYSREIDGLRAVSVLFVVIFHTATQALPGGYVGVDVFFVISGFLITSGLHEQLNEAGRFSFLGFYRRRFARLLPALIITLTATWIMGALLYGNAEFDRLGRDTFFSALGIKNLIDARGGDYFVQEVAYRPLLHMWSLGVEEQYYLVWPLTLALLTWASRRHCLLATLLLFAVFLVISEFGVQNDRQEAYFLPQFRAFELLLGSAAALFVRERTWQPELLSRATRIGLSSLAAAVLIFVAFTFDERTAFPGLNAFAVAIAAIILVLFSSDTPIGWVLSLPPMVWLGLISYPLYLFHQPLISLMLFFDESIDRSLLLIMTLSAGSTLAYATYRWIEAPVRQRARLPGVGGGLLVTTLVLGIVMIGGMGVWTAKSGGFPERIRYLNPYAHELLEAQSETSFYELFQRGVHIGSGEGSKILFVGDSLLEQYVIPLAAHWGFEHDQIDIYSRGGCVMLKGVDYEDRFSDISCADLRQKLYSATAQYDRIVFSQAWDSYAGHIRNADLHGDIYPPEAWKPFVVQSIAFFATLSDRIYIIGPHPRVIGDCRLRIGPMTTAGDVRACLKQQRIDSQTLQKKTEEFQRSIEGLDVKLLSPLDIWCTGLESCALRNGDRPYFRDEAHFGAGSHEFVMRRMAEKGW
jgi:peptidoglycan/LPS O-acetylase OafA/YrhL